MSQKARAFSARNCFVLQALRLGAAHRLSVWDALIVQAATDAGCRVLYSEDLQAGRRFGGVEVVNPFAATVHEAAASYTVRRDRPRTGGSAVAR